MKQNRFKFNIFNFISTFSRAIFEIFMSLFLFKSGFTIKEILLFFLVENFLAIFISYLFVVIGEKFKYSTVMIIGIVAFILLQVSLNYVNTSIYYLLLMSVLYSIYRRGYWVARRFYLTTVIPQNNSTETYSITLILARIASILAGYVGAIILDKFTVLPLTIITSVLLLVGTIPLIKIKYNNSNTKIELFKNLKKYDKRNILAFSFYELNNLLTFLFPIFIAVYIQSTYVMAGSVNAASKLAMIIFIFIYGKIIKKKNHFVLSTALSIFLFLSKLFLLNYFIIIIYFVEGFVSVMQTQSANKIYFENRGGVDATHSNLIYQIIESVARTLAVIPLFFLNDIRMMILVVLVIITICFIIYCSMKKGKKLQ